MKRRDPIIDELHRVREDIAKAHDFDARRIAATIRRHEVIPSPLRQPVPGTSDRPPADGILLGLGGADGAAWHWRPPLDGRRLLVAGPPRRRSRGTG